MSGSPTTYGPSFFAYAYGNLYLPPSVSAYLPYVMIDMKPGNGIPPFLRISWKPIQKPGAMGLLYPNLPAPEDVAILPDITNAGQFVTLITDPTVQLATSFTVIGPRDLTIRTTRYYGSSPSLPWPNGV